MPAPISGLAKPASLLVGFHAGTVPAAQAQPAVSAALALDPRFAPAHIAAGLLAEQKNDFAGARASYEQALKANPGFLIAQRQIVILLADKLAEDAKATELAAALRADFANDAELSGALGKIAYRRADYAEALRLTRLAAAQPSANPELLFYLGMAQYHLKDKAAKATLTRAIAERPAAQLAADAKKALVELK